MVDLIKYLFINIIFNFNMSFSLTIQKRVLLGIFLLLLIVIAVVLVFFSGTKTASTDIISDLSDIYKSMGG